MHESLEMPGAAVPEGAITFPQQHPRLRGLLQTEQVSASLHSMGMLPRRGQVSPLTPLWCFSYG